ncbi:ammonium transporter AmtB-like domain-containing protein [Zychaea mexicana]|uniref:ammonium transporter AmtB-like domain-containing protein n=1 Tax=Zychaea mexicana TaxID=64656 RepID=UPI0022FEDF60|nr:ammonium transporter AmtB-like domain-containing protein [Zychaea mexicana]KAI9489082.1 ammonium transporter AmtB-like domain-containing protein [Zychaea mexicana]
MDAKPDYTIDSGNTAWTLMCATLVFLMTPALGLFYAGLAKAKNALSLMYLTMLCVAVVSFQWYLIGYSLTFSPTANFFIGDATNFLMRGVGVKPAFEGQTIPAMVFMIFQSMFACLTPALAFGAAAERMSLGPSIVFIFVWTTLVYDIITCWVWNPNGWLFKMGAMDFAGGATVHASSGLAAVAYAMVLGKRRDFNENNNTPHNVSFVYIGLALLWFGWFAFNAGSGLAADARAANSLVATHLAACVGAVVWVVIDWIYTRKWSVVGLCTGVVAGLATVTPGSGFVSPSSALLFGLLGSIACNYAVRYKHKYGFDDALDVFTVHYVGGLVGLTLTGIFAERYIIGLGMPEGTPLEEIQIGGWLDGHWMQVPIQLAMIAAVSAWSFIVTYLILIVLNLFPQMQIRLDEPDEVVGIDWAQMGERAYGYIEWEEEMIRMASRHSQHTAQQEELKKSPFRSIRRLLMIDNRTTVKGVPTLIEEPVLDYSQQKEIRMNKMPTGNDVLQRPASVCTTRTVEQHPPSIEEISPEQVGQSSSGTLANSNNSNNSSSSSSAAEGDPKQKSRA